MRGAADRAAALAGRPWSRGAGGALSAAGRACAGRMLPPALAPRLYGENMAPFPEEVDVFSAPHWRMKQLVGLYCDKVTRGGGLCPAPLGREGGFRECAAVSAPPPRRQLLSAAAGLPGPSRRGAAGPPFPPHPARPLQAGAPPGGASRSPQPGAAAPSRQAGGNGSPALTPRTCRPGVGEWAPGRPRRNSRPRHGAGSGHPWAAEGGQAGREHPRVFII